MNKIRAKLDCCYRSYYAFVVQPDKNGEAIISTCYKNNFRPENRLLIKHNIRNAWNSKQFQFQRKLLTKKDWSFCRGASCMHSSTIDGWDNDEIVENAIAKGMTSLDYLPKLLIINPSLLCNNNCYFCFYICGKRKKNNYSLQDNIIEEVKKDIVPFVDCVSISGGEPFYAAKSREFINWAISSYTQKKYQLEPMEHFFINLG